MSRVIITTLGFEEKFTVRSITRHGLDRGDKIVLITGPRVEKSEKAVSFIKDFISKYYLSEVSVSVKDIPIHDIYETISRIKQILIEETRGFDKVIVNLSGGMRIIIIAVILALTLLDIQDLMLEVETEDSSLLITIPRDLLYLPKVEGGKLDVLKVITRKSKPVSVYEIAETLGRDESTVRRHLQKLRRLKLIEVEKIKPLIVKASKTASLLV
ncbi:MAG: CRISPR-associated CARF protein Csa3 [Candidatus Methanomethylicia archaeon]